MDLFTDPNTYIVSLGWIVLIVLNWLRKQVRDGKIKLWGDISFGVKTSFGKKPHDTDRNDAIDVSRNIDRDIQKRLPASYQRKKPLTIFDLIVTDILRKRLAGEKDNDEANRHNENDDSIDDDPNGNDESDCS